MVQGTIESIEPLPQARGRFRWAVTLRVEEVLAGEFSGRTFAFPIHSPTKSGLAVGQQRILRAVQSGDGYVVDEWQWMRGPGPRS